MLTAGLGVAVWVLGDSATAAAEGAANRMIREEEWKPVLKVAVLDAVQKLAEPEARTRVSYEVDQQVPRAVEVEFKKRIATTVEEMRGLDPKALIEAYLRNEAALGAPVGAVVAWPSSVAHPDGWAVCDGGLIDAKHEDRISVILGATYGGAPNGKLKLPDFRGYLLRGIDSRGGDDRMGVDPERPRMLGKEQLDAVGKHSHSIDSHYVSAQGGANTGASLLTDIDEGVMTRRAGSSTSVHPGSETRPVNYAVHWIIRVR